MRKLFPIYPVLLGLTWVLGVYSANQALLLDLKVTLVPMGVTVGVLLGILGITWLTVRDWRKAALVTTLIFLIGVSYGYIPGEIGSLRLVLILGVSAVCMVCWMVLILRGTTLEWRRGLTLVANVMATCILLVVLVNIGTFRIKSPPAIYNPEMVEVEGNTLLVGNSNLPDIYYIIPDQYNNFEMLSRYYGYDNSEFLNYLRDKGFYVVENAHSNYPSTLLSLSSTLNLGYLPETVRTDSTIPGIMLKNHQVGNILREGGYTFVHVRCWAEHVATNKHADVELARAFAGEFSWTLYNSTILSPLVDLLVDFNMERDCRETTLYQFEALKKLPGSPGTTFALVHILLPHGPYMFNADGSLVTPEQEASRTGDEGYLGQLEFATSKLVEVIDTILEDSEEPPIIILQADEGSYLDTWRPYWDGKDHGTMVQDNPELIKVKTGILYAIYLPEATQEELEGLTSPVNTFRVVLNYLFGWDLDILPDRYCINNGVQFLPPYNFIDVTDIVRGR